MSRPQKPWYRKQTGWWMVEMEGKQEKLVEGPKDEAHRKLAEEKMVELRQLKRHSPQSTDARVVDIIEAYLRFSRAHLAEDTHRLNLYFCQLFAEHCGMVLARELKPYHITEWVTAMMSPERVAREKAEKARLRKQAKAAGDKSVGKMGGDPRVWGETTVYNARKISYRVFSWAKEEGVLPNNPLEGMKRPKPSPRQRAMNDEEYNKLYEQAGGPLRDLLFSLRESGARPKELRQLLWTQVNEGRIILKKHKTSRKVSKDRVIYLTEAMKELFSRLAKNGHTHVFLNTEGKPWTMTALRQQIWRLKKRLGLADDVCAYLCRHGFGTRAVLNGVNPATVAELMGHTSLDMVSKVYVHLADQHEHLKGAVEKINSPAPADPARPSEDVPVSTRKRAKPVNPKKPGPKPKQDAE